MQYYISPPPKSPLNRFVAAIIAVFALIGSFMIGLAALLVVGAIVLVVGIAIWLRVAWIKRRLKKSGIDLDADTVTKTATGHVIDAEYTVISDSEDQDKTTG